MPYEYKGNRNTIEPTDSLPSHLQHKPVYALPYEHFDGPHRGETDARYISVGLAQWNHGEVSLKVFRHTGADGKWTRMSEELPMHRLIDAALFLAKVIFDRDPSDASVTLPAGTLEGQDAELVISREDIQVMGANFDRYLKDKENWDRLKERYRALHEVLDKLAKDGKL